MARAIRAERVGSRHLRRYSSAMPHGRREMLVALAGAPFAARLLAGCGDEPVAPRIEGALLGPSVEHGHRLRDRSAPTLAAFERAPERRVGVAIVGGGPSGL